MRSCPPRVVFTWACALAVLLWAATAPALAQVKLSFDKRPSMKAGNLLTAGIRFKAQVDFRDFPDEPETPSKPVVDLPRTRIGVEGRLMREFDYQIEGELSDASQPWRDIFIQTRSFRLLQVRAGQFKIPFSLEQLTSGMDLDFNYRSLAASFLAPGRDVGLMVFGRAVNETLRYQAGVFKHGGDNVRESERTDAQADRTYAGRLVVRPWNTYDNLFRTFSAGVAFTTGVLPAGPNGVRGKTIPGDTFFQQLFVNGNRRRIGGEFQWRPGPVQLQGEYIETRDQRFGQGIENQDLPNAYARGWYASGVWLLTGGQMRDSIAPDRPFLRGGIGAIEIGVRRERLAAWSPGVNDGSFSSPRAPWVMPRADDVWTAGVNWFWNPFVKLVANVIHERRTEDGRVLVSQGNLWSQVFRVQLGF